MPYFDRHPNQFRLAFGFIAGALLIIGAISLYRFASSPTDENIFTNPPTDLYVVKSISAINGKDSMLVGDLLVRVNGSKVSDEDGVQQLLAQAERTTVLVEVVRTAEDKRKKFEVEKSLLQQEQFFRRVGPTAWVISVAEGGASDRAGVKVGDLIVRINGQRFKNSTDADRIMREGQIGKAIAYDVLRNNEMLTLHVALAAFGMPISTFVLTLAGLAWFGVGVFLSLARPRFIAARLYGLALLTLGFFALTIFSTRGGSPTDPFHIIRGIVLLLSAFLSMSLLLHVSHYFPKERPELLSRRWIRIGGYVMAVVGIALTEIGQNSGFILGIALLLLYDIVIKIAFRKQASEEYKRMNRPMRYGSIITGAGALALGVYLGLTNRLQDLGFLGFFIILVPLALLYTIGRYRLLDLDLRVRRNVQYMIVTAAWVLVIAVLAVQLLVGAQGMKFPIPNIHVTATSIEILDSPLDTERQLWYEKGLLMLIAVVTVYLAWKVGQVGQRVIDKKFYRARYDYRRAATELSEMMATKLTMVDLARGMVQKLSELMQLKQVGVLFFRDQQICCCQEAYGFDGTSWKEFCLSSEIKIAEAIKQFRNEFSVDYLPPDIKEAFRDQGFHYVVPIRSKEQLVGAILVGEKLSEATFQSEDLLFLASVAKQASMAIENAFLYEELAEQERMKHELAIARRIQMQSLPQQTPTIEGLDIAGISIPALEVGGDYFDYLNGEANELTVIVGDVSGKGTSAALYMSKVQGILRSLHAFGLSPKELFVRTNRLLYQDLEKKSFVTAIGGFFTVSARQLVLARAGHLPLYRYVAATRRVEKITPRGLGLGLEAAQLFSAELEEKVLLYGTNDIFVFVSDGITEAQKSDGRQFGEENLMSEISAVASGSAHEIRDHIIAAVKQFTDGTEQHDDQTIVVVKTV